MDVEADIARAREAWEAARAAIDEAWRVTPDYLCKEKFTVRRGLKNQGAALGGAEGMLAVITAVERIIGIHQRARAKHTEWAIQDDLTAALTVLSPEAAAGVAADAEKAEARKKENAELRSKPGIGYRGVR